MLIKAKYVERSLLSIDFRELKEKYNSCHSPRFRIDTSSGSLTAYKITKLYLFLYKLIKNNTSIDGIRIIDCIYSKDIGTYVNKEKVYRVEI